MDIQNNKSVLWNTRKIFTRFFHRGYDKIRGNSLLLFCFYGFFGSVVIDLDHIISQPLGMGRPLHLPIFILVGIICCIISTPWYRRFYNVSVRRDIK